MEGEDVVPPSAVAAHCLMARQFLGWWAGEGKRECLYLACSCPVCLLAYKGMGWLSGFSFPFPILFLPVLHRVGKCIPWDFLEWTGKTVA